jgi:hypothetical protein
LYFRGHNKRLWMPVHLTLPARNDKMVEMVKTMLLTADGLRPAASEIWIVEGQ